MVVCRLNEIQMISFGGIPRSWTRQNFENSISLQSLAEVLSSSERSSTDLIAADVPSPVPPFLYITPVVDPDRLSPKSGIKSELRIDGYKAVPSAVRSNCKELVWAKCDLFDNFDGVR